MTVADLQTQDPWTFVLLVFIAVVVLVLLIRR